MMQTTLDLPTAQRFADDLNVRLSQCDDQEGQILRELHETITRYSRMCRDLDEFVNEWADGIWRGRSTCEPPVETLLRTELRTLRDRAKSIAALGQVANGQLLNRESLNELNVYILKFDRMLDPWVTPQLSVSPAPRTTISEAAAAEIFETIKTLPPMSPDWLPDDPVQAERIRKLRKK